MAGLEIHEAAAQGDADTLLEHLHTGKFDVNLKDNDWNDKTALHWASSKGKLITIYSDNYLQIISLYILLMGEKLKQ